MQKDFEIWWAEQAAFNQVCFNFMGPVRCLSFNSAICLSYAVICDFILRDVIEL